MKKTIQKLFAAMIVSCMILCCTDAALHLGIAGTVAQAHSGRTDSSGGHRDNKNKSGLGSYHYHCGGYPAHLHSNGTCPYQDTSQKQTSSTTTKKKSSVSSVVKKAQKALNKLGYECGKADGIMGKKTKQAIKDFQKDNDLTVDGKLGKKTKKALGIK